ncbi:MAG: hypothetical protein HYX34_03825 [Actinobacteria bacterium]|nr:hypothetical protein [Actinomycetota bacterium]
MVRARGRWLVAAATGLGVLWLAASAVVPLPAASGRSLAPVAVEAPVETGTTRVGATTTTTTVGAATATTTATTTAPASTPRLVVQPRSVGPGEPFSVTVTGCPVEPFVIANWWNNDVVGTIPLVEQPDGSWRYEAAASDGPDAFFFGSCGSQELRGRLDVEVPLVSACCVPGGPLLRDGGYTVFGTDCDRPRTVELTVEHPGVADRTIVRSPDAAGDWRAFVAVLADGQPTTVRARCGTISYQVIGLPAVAGPAPTTVAPVPPTTLPPYRCRRRDRRDPRPAPPGSPADPAARAAVAGCPSTDRRPGPGRRLARSTDRRRGRAGRAPRVGGRRWPVPSQGPWHSSVASARTVRLPLAVAR